MRKYLFALVAIFLMATSAYAEVDTDNGPISITTAYAVGTPAMTSGSVVVLQTTSPTYWGREVTGSTTKGMAIWGVVVDSTNYTGIEMISGKWLRIQTKGYCPIVRMESGISTTANNAVLVTSGTSLKATTCSELAINNGNKTPQVTGTTIALESLASQAKNSTHIIKAVINQ